MKRITLAHIILLLAAIALSQQAMGAVTLLRNPGFDLGVAGWSNHWWSPWDWYTFTMCPPTEGAPAEYIWRDWATGPNALPTDNGFPGWNSLGFAWDPMTGVSADTEYRTAPWCDTSDGYDHPRVDGEQYMKQWYPSTNHGVTGWAQYIGPLEVGKTYEVSAYAYSSAPVPPDMRILIDPAGGNDVRTAPISSAPAPTRPGGRYWIWSSTGNNRIGDFTEATKPDVTGTYIIYDKLSVQFTATTPNATVFLLVGQDNWYDPTEGTKPAAAWDQVSIREVHAPVSTIAAARTAPEGTPVTLTNVVVSAVYPAGIYGEGADPCFFAQDSGRSSGVLVLSGRDVSPGDVVTITGETKTYNGSSAVKCTGMTKTSSGVAPKPVGMTNAASGGAGVAGGKGADTLGLLTQIWGKVVESGQWSDPVTGDPTYTYALIDDGSAVESAPHQPVLNNGFERYSGGAWDTNPPGGWTRKKALDSTSHIQIWWYHNWGSLVGPKDGSIYAGRVGGVGRSWMYQQVMGLSAGESAVLKVWAYAGGDPNAKVRIGVDPNGGSSQSATSIIWSPYVNTNKVWQELSVSFTAGASVNTVWLESNHTGATANGTESGFDEVRIYAPSVARKGVKVILPPLSWPPSPGDYWCVTGNLWTELQPGETTPTRLLIPRSTDDIVTVWQ